MKLLYMNGISGYINLLLGVSLTSAGWIADIIPSLKALSILIGIVVMTIYGWQLYQKGRLEKCKRKEIENGKKDRNN